MIDHYTVHIIANARKVGAMICCQCSSMLTPSSNNRLFCCEHMRDEEIRVETKFNGMPL